MRNKQLHVLLSVISTVVGAAVAFLITYLDSKYFLLGVQAERGYEAVGGEFIFLLVIFGGMYYSTKHFIYKLIRNIIEEMDRYPIR